LPSLQTTTVRTQSQFDPSLETLGHRGHGISYGETLLESIHDSSMMDRYSSEHAYPGPHDIIGSESMAQSKTKQRKCRALSLSLNESVLTETPEEKGVRIRKRNRIASERFRQRQRDHESFLQSKILQLTSAQNGLRENIDSLQTEILSLKSQLSAHHCRLHLPSPCKLSQDGSTSPMKQNAYVNNGGFHSSSSEDGVPPLEIGISNLQAS
jgi:hypothetical protein